MTVTPLRTHIRIDSALRACAATTRSCARATSHTAATSSSVISVRADGTAGVDVSPDGTIFSTSTPSLHARSLETRPRMLAAVDRVARDDVEARLRRRGAEARREALVEVELRVLQRQQHVLFDRN